MPRPKGSKNKAPRKITVANNDFEALIAEKTSAKENLTVDIASLEENLREKSVCICCLSWKTTTAIS